LLAQFADWLNIDHPNIIQRIGMNGSYKRIMSKVHPRTLRNYLGTVRNYLHKLMLEKNSIVYNARQKLPKNMVKIIGNHVHL
jgi:hypothetical protein